MFLGRENKMFKIENIRNLGINVQASHTKATGNKEMIQK